MQVTVETTDGLERRMRVEIPEERVESQVGDRLKSMMQSAKLPGFRPGKVPLKVVEQRFGRQVRDEVVGELVQSSFYDAIVKEKLRPAGGPTIDPLDAKPGEGLSYTAVFEIYPDISVGSVEELNVTRPICEVDDAEIDNMLETLRKQRKTWKEVDRPAADGDQVVLDYEGIIDGEAFDGGTATESDIEVGAGRMLKDLEDGLVGKKAGDEASLDMAFPEDYHAKDVAGKPVTFNVKVHRVEEAVLPEVDEEFAKGFGISDGGLDGFRKEIRANMERELEDTLRARTKQRVMDALIEANPVQVPGALVQDEKMRIAEVNRRQFANQGLELEKLGITLDDYEVEATRRVSLGILVAELVKANDIKPEPEKVKARIDTIASSYEDPQQVVNWYYSERERLQEIESNVLEDEVVEWVLGRAKVTEEQTSFDALMNPGQTSSEAE